IRFPLVFLHLDTPSFDSPCPASRASSRSRKSSSQDNPWMARLPYQEVISPSIVTQAGPAPLSGRKASDSSTAWRSPNRYGSEDSSTAAAPQRRSQSRSTGG